MTRMEEVYSMKTTRRLLVSLVIFAFALSGLMPGFAEEKEQKVRLSDCPEAVQKTIKENAVGGKIIEVEKETSKSGTVTYEAEIKTSDGKVIEIEVAEDGKLLKTEAEDDDEDEDGEDDDD